MKNNYEIQINKLDTKTMYDKARIVQLTNLAFFQWLYHYGVIVCTGKNPVGNQMYSFDHNKL